MLITKNKILSLLVIFLFCSFAFAITLDITSPTSSGFYKSDQENFNFGGDVADLDGVVFVAYSNTVNGETSAIWFDNVVSAQWNAILPLEFGTNIIQVWAEDVNQETDQDSIIVVLGNAVSVDILQPTAENHIEIVGDDSLVLSGTASGGDYDIASVSCIQTYKGGTNSYVVSGSNVWNTEVSLFAGSNIFEISAKSTSGKKGSDFLLVAFVEFNIQITKPTDHPIGYINTN